MTFVNGTDRFDGRATSVEGCSTSPTRRIVRSGRRTFSPTIVVEELLYATTSKYGRHGNRNATKSVMIVIYTIVILQ